ncbi:MAG TPA: O-antigen ligase family protein [Blastocatellia bacterium]|nr:O-antigen ligase family protein [Blastocatellia bacterium]
MLTRLTRYWKNLNLSERCFILLPFLILTPRLTPVMAISHNGETSPEVTFSLAALFMALLLWRTELRKRLFLSGSDVKLLTAMLLFTGWSLLSLLWSPDANGTLHYAGLWLTYLVLFFSGRMLLRRRAVVALATTLLLTACILSFLRLCEYLTIAEARPVQSLMFVNFGIVPEILLTLLPLAVVTWLRARRGAVAWSSLAAAVLIWMAGLSTYQFTPLLAAAVALLVLTGAVVTGWLRPRHWSRVVALLAVMAVMALCQFNLPSKADGYQIASNASGYDLIRRKVEMTRTGKSSLGIRLLIWRTALEMGLAYPLTGTGAGSFKSVYYQYRALVAERPEMAGVLARADADDDELVIRTHNEFIQVFAELGVIGLALLGALLLLLFLRCRGSAVHQRGAALSVCAGALAFLVSSCLSSFSFRWIPCGACFFLLITLLPKPPGSLLRLRTEDGNRLSPGSLSRGMAGLLAVLCLLSCGLSLRVLAGQYLLGRGRAIPRGSEDKIRQYHSAIAADPANFAAHFALGRELFLRGRHREAVSHLEFSLRHGISNTYGFAILAFAYEGAGELRSAQRVLREGVASYPTSVFIRALYGHLLEINAEPEAAAANRAVMQQLDPLLAAYWERALQIGQQNALIEFRQCGPGLPGNPSPGYGRQLLAEREQVVLHRTHAAGD